MRIAIRVPDGIVIWRGAGSGTTCGSGAGGTGTGAGIEGCGAQRPAPVRRMLALSVPQAAAALIVPAVVRLLFEASERERALGPLRFSSAHPLRASQAVQWPWIDYRRLHPAELSWRRRLPNSNMPAKAALRTALVLPVNFQNDLSYEPSKDKYR